MVVNGKATKTRIEYANRGFTVFSRCNDVEYLKSLYALIIIRKCENKKQKTCVEILTLAQVTLRVLYVG